DEEWKRLEPIWTGCGLPRGQWCRNILLGQTASSQAVSGTVPEMVLLLAEVLASRTILINLLHAVGRGDSLSAEQLRALTERADGEKIRRALERLQQFGKQRTEPGREDTYAK